MMVFSKSANYFPLASNAKLFGKTGFTSAGEIISQLLNLCILKV